LSATFSFGGISRFPSGRTGESVVKKIVLLIAALGAGLFVVKKRRDAQSEADLWREATSSSDLR